MNSSNSLFRMFIRFDLLTWPVVSGLPPSATKASTTDYARLTVLVVLVLADETRLLLLLLQLRCEVECGI